MITYKRKGTENMKVFIDDYGVAIMTFILGLCTVGMLFAIIEDVILY